MRDVAETDRPVVSIIVVSFNTRDITLECLKSVFAQTRTPFELIVVDNASTDGSAKAIADAFPAKDYPQLTLIAERSNHGFAPAHDVALPYATAPWLLLLNPDTVVLDHALDKLLAFAERTPQAGIWGGRTLFADGTLNPTSCWGRMTLWSVFCQAAGLNAIARGSRLFNPEGMGNWQRDSERYVDIVTGCLFLMRKDDWLSLGGFDPTFHMYGEEADLCRRAAARGMQPRMTPDATIIHLGGASETVRADKSVRLLRSKAELIKRHFHPLTRGIGLLMFRLWPLGRKLGYGVAAAFTASETLKEKARSWSEVWARRREWAQGYGDGST